MQALQKKFFDDDLRKNLYKNILFNLELKNVSKDDKYNILNKLSQNMKSIFKKIDLNKITSSNFNDVLEQYKKQVILDFIKNNSSEPNQNNSMKYRRDFESIPTHGNKFLDRPEASKLGNTNKMLMQHTNNVNGYNLDPEPSLDGHFKPIVDDTQFNQYIHNTDINSTMDMMMKQRQMEISSNRQVPAIPDKLRPIETSSKNKQYNEPTTNQLTNLFTNQSNQINNNELPGVLNDSNFDLNSIENINQQLSNFEMKEDTSSFEERLQKQLKERENISLTIQSNTTQLPQQQQLQQQQFQPQLQQTKQDNNNDNNNYKNIIERMQNEINKLNSENNILVNNETKMAEYIKELQIKDKEISLKESKLNSIQYLQLDISSSDSKYIHRINKISNVSNIKLISYSLPQTLYNIQHKNNILKFEIDNEIIIIELDYGKYSIDELLITINDRIEKYFIKLSLSIEQKISISSTNENIVKIILTNLLKNNLGFINDVILNNNSEKANNLWDLRIDNGVMLYLDNLSEYPFSKLCYNGQSIGQFKFNKLMELDRLEIRFDNCNFYNLPYNLFFLITYHL